MKHVPCPAASAHHAKKKILKASEGDTPRVERLRADYWRLGVSRMADRLVFVDETGINLSMTRRYARAPCGERALGFVPRDWATA